MATYNDNWNVLAIHRFLKQYYTLEQIYSLGRKVMGSEKWDEIKADTKSDSARNLVTWCERFGKTWEMLNALTHEPTNPNDGTVTGLQRFYGAPHDIQQVYGFLAQYTHKLLEDIAKQVGFDHESIVGISTRAYAEDLTDACVRTGRYSLLITKMQN